MKLFSFCAQKFNLFIQISRINHLPDKLMSVDDDKPHQAISLYRKTLIAKVNRAILANSKVNLVLNNIKQHLTDNPTLLTPDVKGYICNPLSGK